MLSYAWYSSGKYVATKHQSSKLHYELNAYVDDAHLHCVGDYSNLQGQFIVSEVKQQRCNALSMHHS